KAPQGAHELSRVVLRTGCGNERHEDLPGLACLAGNQVPQITGLLGLVVGDEPLLAGPLANGIANRVAEVGRQPAALDLEHVVPTSGLVEAERGPVLELCERVLELVAVVEDLLGGDERLERRI